MPLQLMGIFLNKVVRRYSLISISFRRLPSMLLVCPSFGVSEYSVSVRALVMLIITIIAPPRLSLDMPLG